MSISKIKMVGRRPLNIIVYENIKMAIIKGEIEPGTRLTETKVGEQMGVSTTPVREAFRRLESERLVKIIPWRGAVVQEFSIEQIDEAYECRQPLELLAIELAVGLIDEDGISRLEDLVEKADATSDHKEQFDTYKSIHQLIIEYANNKTLTQLIKHLSDSTAYTQHGRACCDQRREDISQEYKQIIQALKERDKFTAVEAMKTHINNEHRFIKELFS